MKRLSTVFTLVWACAVTMGLHAQLKQTTPKRSTHAAPAAMAGAAHAVGPISGAPTGKTFVVASGKKRTTVDATKATVRNHGKFASFNDLRSGTFVRAEGTMNGATLMASTVEIIRQPGGRGKNGSTPPNAPPSGRPKKK